MDCRTLSGLVLVGVFSAGIPTAVHAQDSVLGTFTVGGKTTTFRDVYATLEAAPDEPSQKYLMLLVSSVPIPPADRAPSRLATMAAAGTLQALRLRWKYGTDAIAVVPYHSAIAESGQAFASMATVNLSALDEQRVHAEFKAKMLGQTWFFNALVKAAIVKGEVAILEPGTSTAPATAGATGKSDPASLKRSLGAMGLEFTADAFYQAIADGKADAVTLFIQAGMSPNQKSALHTRAPLNYATLFCDRSPEQSAAVIAALLAGKADVSTRDPDNGTTPLVNSVQSCSASAVAALIKAGSDLKATAKSGMTALQLARIFQRSEVVALLEKAGAK